jgi:hypothetical protein
MRAWPLAAPAHSRVAGGTALAERTVMHSRNVVFIVAVPFDGDLAYSAYAIDTWRHWCKRNDIRLVVSTDPLEDGRLMKPHWHRYHLFEILDQQGIEYDRVAYVDCDAMVRWDCPNFFLTADDNLGVVRDQTPRWIQESIKAHSRLFPATRVSWYDYFNSGFLLLTKAHREFFASIRTFYRANRSQLLKMEESGEIGLDQTPVNYLARREGVGLTFLPPIYNLQPLAPLLKDFLFAEMGYIWHFAGMSSEERHRHMGDTWRAFAQHYAGDGDLRRQAPDASPPGDQNSW